MQQMPDLWPPNIAVHHQQPHLCCMCPTPPHEGSPLHNCKLQSRTLMQPPTDPLRQLSTTTQSNRPKLLHLRQNHMGHAPQHGCHQRYNDGHLESTKKVLVLYYLLYCRSSYCKSSLSVTYLQTAGISGEWRKLVVRSPPVRSQFMLFRFPVVKFSFVFIVLFGGNRERWKPHGGGRARRSTYYL